MCARFAITLRVFTKPSGNIVFDAYIGNALLPRPQLHINGFHVLQRFLLLVGGCHAAAPAIPSARRSHSPNVTIFQWSVYVYIAMSTVGLMRRTSRFARAVLEPFQSRTSVGISSEIKRGRTFLEGGVYGFVEISRASVGDENTGRRALRELIRHPSLDLVGVFVYNSAKKGIDAGKLCGRRSDRCSCNDRS